VIVWDTWSKFLKTCGVYAKTYPDKFRERNQWSAHPRIRPAEINKAGTFYEAEIIGQLSRLAPTVILVTHLKNLYINNAQVQNKQIPDSGKTLMRVPRMRIWLRQNPDGRPVPIGLFLKRFDKKIITENGLRTLSVVPRKIVPADGDMSLWDTIGRYWDDPVGNRPPTPEETPNEYELSILDGTLTADQRRTLNLMLRAGMVDSDEVELEPAPKERSTQEKVQELAGSTTPEEIAKELGVPLPVVKAMLK